MKSDKLTFFCQMCDAEIKGNICPEHGIDFVTIKKALKKTAASSNVTSNRNDSSSRASAEDRAAKAEHRKTVSPNVAEQSSAYLPVLPTETGEDQALKPLSKKSEQPAAGTIGASVEDSEYVFAHEAEYQELDAESLHRYYERQSRSRHKPTRVGSSNRKLMLTMLSIVTLIILAGIYFSSYTSQGTAADLYSRAEMRFGSQAFAQAEELYNRLIEIYPNDPLARVARQRLDRLSILSAEGAESTQEQRKQIQGWLFKANLAYRYAAYLEPENDNVLLYINRVMAIEPSNPAALELKWKMMRHYENLAEIALKDRNYDAALGFYQKVLKISPGGDKTIESMRKVLEMKAAESR